MDILPQITRHRLEPRRRNLTVTRTTRVTPAMLRLRLEGPELHDFASPGPDDHIKLIVPDAKGESVMRDYTPRRFDSAAGWIEIDFALHEAGPATLWALSVRPGDPAQIAGPRGSKTISGPIDDWLLVGDETALPAIARRIEEMPLGTRVTSLVAIPSPEDAQEIETQAEHRALWLPRHDPRSAEALMGALRFNAPGPRTYVWIAAEAHVARQVKALAIELGAQTGYLSAAGYWVDGQADASAKDL